MPWPWLQQFPARRSAVVSSSQRPSCWPAASRARSRAPTIKFKRSSLVVVTGGREIKFDVDLALNDAERARGLMFREKLGPYEGMLFDFYQEAPVSFWMKNTLIPLDMIFIAADGTIRHIHANAVPNVDRDHPQPVPGARRARDQRRQRQAARHQARRQGPKHPIFGNA